MIKVVYNGCFGGFGLSRRAFLRLRELGEPTALAEPDFGEKYPSGDVRKPFVASDPEGDAFCREVCRHDPRVVQVVEELGEAASARYAQLRIKALSGNRYRIDEYDGSEGVQEPDDIEWVVVSEEAAQ